MPHMPPVIVLSAYPEDKAKVTDCLFLRKPIHLADLMRLVEVNCQRANGG